MNFLKIFYKSIIPEKQRIETIWFLKRIIAPFYLGNNYYCNCCNRFFRKFLSKGNIKRKNAECPLCGSLERTRVLFSFLKNETKIFSKGNKILHIAPEHCLIPKFKNIDIEYVDGDINPANASNVIDITQINYPDNYFDYIICSHVLGHIPDENKAVKELYRVIKTTGTVLIMTLLDPNNEKTYENSIIRTPEERLKHYSEPDLCRLHGLDFPERLNNGGFYVTKVDYRDKILSENKSMVNLGDGKREIIFLCTKI